MQDSCSKQTSSQKRMSKSIADKYYLCVNKQTAPAMMYWFKTPEIIPAISQSLIWKIQTDLKQLYLTFDDGPTPGVTDKVLDLLNLYDAKATFFMVGNNAQKYPELVREVADQGHMIGNHTFNHKNGWNVSSLNYLREIQQTQNLFYDEFGLSLEYFRPPYGKLTPWVSSAINTHYKIVMWDVLAGDFDPKLPKEACADKILKHAENGSIIVLHDSVKCQEKMLHALKQTLQHFADRGFSFHSLP